MYTKSARLGVGLVKLLWTKLWQCKQYVR